MTEEHIQHIGFRYAMPNNQTMEIRPSKHISEEVGLDEEIDGVVYQIFWNNQPLPWCTKTQFQAMAIALGCQYGAMKMHTSIFF